MTELVPGGGGYIGSHTCTALPAASHQPVVYDNLIRENSWAIRWGDWVESDIAYQDRIAETIRKYNIDAILHFVPFGYVGESIGSPKPDD